MLRARRVDAPEPLSCTIQLGGQLLEPLEVSGSYREQRVELPAELLRSDHALLAIDCPVEEARLSLDHALIAPRTGATASLASERAKAAQHAQAVQ